MRCANCRDKLADYTAGALPGAQERAVELHLKECPVCRAEADAFEALDSRLAERGAAFSDTSLGDEVMDRLISTPRETTRRRIMAVLPTKRTFVAAAAVLIVAVAAALVFPTGRPAYALEQTMEALRDLRSAHMQEQQVPPQGVSDVWAEFDGSGDLKRIRLEFPHEVSGGPKTVLWEDGVVRVWSKAKKGVGIRYSSDTPRYWSRGLLHPRQPIERLKEARAAGEVRLESQEPDSEGEPIRLVATWTDGSGRRWRCLVDPETRLALRLSEYRKENGEYVLRWRRDYLSYNEPIPEDVFEFDLPSDVQVVDTRPLQDSERELKAHDPELYREICRMGPAQVARAFFAACADEDWDRAELFLLGVSDRTKGTYGGLTLITVGEAVREEGYAGQYVPYSIRLKSGETQEHRLAVRRHRVLHRLVVDGGI